MDAGAIIANRDFHIAFGGDAGRDDDLPLVDLPQRECLQGVVDQVHHDLLDLGAIEHDRRQIRGELAPVLDAVRLRIRLNQLGELLHDRIDVRRGAHEVRGLGQGPESADDIARADRLIGDLTERRAHFLDIGTGHAEESVTGVREGGNGRQRLIHFVCDSGGHLANGCQPRYVYEAFLQAVRVRFRLTLLGVVMHEPDESGWFGLRYDTHGQQGREQGAVLALCEHFAPFADDMRDACLDVPGQEPVVGAPVPRAHEDTDIAADDLRGNMTEQALRRPIEALNRAAMVNHQDAIDCSVKERLQFERGIYGRHGDLSNRFRRVFWAAPV